MKNKSSMERRLRFEELEGRRVLSALPVLHAPVVQDTTSSNWSGYAVQTTANAVTSVSGSWKVPAVSGQGPAYSAVWVGIDGYSSSTVEQIGTESDVLSNGSPSYYAWYEMYPNYSYNISNTTSPTGVVITSSTFTVKPGDSITASVQYVTTSTGSAFQLTLNDGSEFFTIVIPQAASSGRHSAPQAQRSSAEWIVEAPSSGYGVLPLADFTSPVSFTGASFTVSASPTTQNAIDGPFSSSVSSQIVGVDLIDMASSSGQEDTTSVLGRDGASFTVAYDVPTPTAPTRRRGIIIIIRVVVRAAVGVRVGATAAGQRASVGPSLGWVQK